MLYSGTDGRTDTHTHTHTQTEEIEDIFTLGEGGGGSARSIREIPLSSYEVPIINLLVSIQTARSSVIYYIQHHNASAAYDAT